MRSIGHDTPPVREDSNIVWFARQCASNDVRLESLVRSAERAGDTELADFFRRAQAESLRARAA
jgi:hypothetical protein